MYYRFGDYSVRYSISTPDLLHSFVQQNTNDFSMVAYEPFNYAFVTKNVAPSILINVLPFESVETPTRNWLAATSDHWVPQYLTPAFADVQTTLSVDFVDDFNRPDGPIGNGWSNCSHNSANLIIRNDALSAPQPDGNGGIFRPVDMSSDITVSASVTELNGFGGLHDRFGTELLFGSNGRLDNGYGIAISRGDQNYSDSRVVLVHDGTNLETAFSTFQFHSEINVSVTYHPDGSIAGTISGDGATFNFSFDARAVQMSGANFELEQGFPDGRTGTLIYPTIDNLTIHEEPTHSAHAPTADAVAAMSFMSWAAYHHQGSTLSENLATSGWAPVTAASLGISTEDIAGEFFEQTIILTPPFPFLPFAVQIAACLAVKDDVLTISFRGSDNESDLVNNQGDFLAAALDQSGYFEGFSNFLDAALNYATSNGISAVYVTGHSLGGAMAEWFAAKDAATFGQLGLDVSIATFGSPGTSSELTGNSYLTNVLEFGNARDAVFNHSGFLHVLDVTGQEHRGIPISVTVPNVIDPHPSINFYQHGDGTLYAQEMRALAASPFGQEYLDSGASRMLIIDALLDASGEAPIDFSTSSRPLLIIGDSEIPDIVFLDADTIYGGTKSDWIDGGIGEDILLGNAGSDRMVGGLSTDWLTGGTGQDTLSGGEGSDWFRYDTVSDSSTAQFDIITDFDATVDEFQTWVAVEGVDSAVTHGKFSNIEALLDAGHLGASHAVLFTPNKGADAGNTFLAIDGNGIAGFQADGDLVIQLDGALNLATLSVDNFIVI